MKPMCAKAPWCPLLLRWRIGRILPHAPSTARVAAPAARYGFAMALLATLTGAWPGTAHTSSTLAVSEMGPPQAGTLFTAGHPVLAFHPQLGEFVAAWDGRDSDHGLGEREVFVRRLHRSLPQALFGQIRITAINGVGANLGSARSPQILPVSPCIPQVCWMMVFEGFDLSLPSAGEQRVFVLPLGADALPSAPPRPISRFVAAERSGRYPLLVRGGPDSFLALWVQREVAGSGIDGHEIYARKLLPDGSTPEVPARVSSGSGHARSVYAVAAAHDSLRGETLVVWQDRSPAESADRILARFVDAEGAALSPLLPLADCGADECFGLAVARAAGSTRYMLLWIEAESGLAHGARRVMAMAIDALAGPLGPPVQVSSEASFTWSFADGANSGDTGAPAVAWLPRAQRFAALWKESGTADGEGRMVGVRLRSDLAPPIERFVVSEQSGGRVQFAGLANDPALDGKVWATWTADHLHAGDYEVLARQLPVAAWREQAVFRSGFEP